MRIPVDSIPASIVDNSNSKQVKIYPNPASNYLVVESGVSSAKNILLYDVNGRELNNIPFTTGQLRIDMSSYTNGVYLIAVGDYRERIILARNR